MGRRLPGAVRPRETDRAPDRRGVAPLRGTPHIGEAGVFGTVWDPRGAAEGRPPRVGAPSPPAAGDRHGAPGIPGRLYLGRRRDGRVSAAPAGRCGRDLLHPRRGDRVEFSGCQAGTALAYVDWEGNLYPCDSLPIRLGSIEERTLEEVWNSPLRGRVADTVRSTPWACDGCAEHRPSAPPKIASSES